MRMRRRLPFVALAAVMAASASATNYLMLGPKNGRPSYISNHACRTCRHHANKGSAIWVQRSAMGQAGLADRCGVISIIVQLAQTVCARVFAPKPCIALASVHDNDKALPCNVSWSHFISFQSVQTGQQLLIDRPPSLMTPPSTLIINGTRRIGGNSTHVANQYDEAFAAAERGQRFVWLLGQPFWTWYSDLRSHVVKRSRGYSYPAAKWLPPRLAPSIPPAPKGTSSKGSAHRQHQLSTHSCEQVNISSSAVVTQMAREVESAIGAPLSSITAIHLRRGDSLGFVTCNTSAAHIAWLVQEEVRNSAAGRTEREEVVVMGMGRAARVRALVFTDEREPEYMAELISGISRAYGGEGAAQLGDPVIASLLQKAAPLIGPPLAKSNYMTYAVGNKIFMEAKGQMKFGWGTESCYREECDKQGTVGRQGEEDACKTIRIRRRRQ